MPRTVTALALSTHPGPTVAVTAITVILGVGIGLEPWRIVLLGLAYLAGQASVGLSNDWIDADRDRAVGRSDKPVAAGRIRASTVRAAAIVTLLLAVALTAPLGWPATLAHAAFIASAWAYNAGLKGTVLSVAPYVVSFGLLPLVVTLSRDEPAAAAPWAMLAGSLLGIAAHFANVLPDLDDDRATGVRGLPHRLGPRVSGAVIAVALAGASLSLVLGPGDAAPWQYAGLAASVLLAGWRAALALRGALSRTAFRIIIAAALIDVLLLALSGTRLLA